jgi:hypothetical protein
MQREPTTVRRFLVALLIIVALAAAAIWLLARPAAAAPRLPSSYVPWPPQIQVVAPVEGTYLLIEHRPERDVIATRAYLFAGERARFPILITDGATPYHVQVTSYENDRLAIYETPRYTGAWRLGLPLLGNLSP